jgi:hypothetical protein
MFLRVVEGLESSSIYWKSDGSKSRKWTERDRRSLSTSGKANAAAQR